MSAEGLQDGEPRWARRLYRTWAPVYDWIRRGWSSPRAEAELDRLFAARIGPGTDVLELAPGTGINLRRLLRHAPRFRSYRGIDVSPEMLARARRSAGGDPRVALELGDARDLSGGDERYGFIVCTWLLSHLEEPECTVKSALERLAPGGTAAFLFFTAPASVPVRRLLGLFLRSFRGRWVDLDAIAALPHCEAVHALGLGYAHLVVFRRPGA